MLRRAHSTIPHVQVSLTPESSKNVVLVKGTPEEATSVRLTGCVTFSASDAVAVKRITVRVVGTMRLKWQDTVNVPRMSAVQQPVRYDKTVFDQETSGLEPRSRASPANPSSARGTPAGSMSNLASYFSHGSHGSTLASAPTSPLSRNSSMSNLASAAGLGSHGHGSNHHLGAGEHNLPFEMVLPGTIAESVEGNPYVQIVYWMVATIERGRFQSNLTTKKHIRIVRTLGIDTYDHTHTVSIENTWPNKVDYSIDVPSKSIPIGGFTQIRFQLTPLDKGLNVGRVKLQIVEYIHMSLPSTQSHTAERVVTEQSFSSDDLQQDADEWEFVRMLQVPRSLTKLTPDTVVQPNVKITHKMRIFIALLNRDGHTSELRASLPIHLYISPDVNVSSQDISAPIIPGQPLHEELVFPDSVEPDQLLTPASTASVAAPPNYSAHVYDRLWSEVATPLDSPSPVHSGSVTPLISSSRGSLMDMDAAQRAQLSAGLRAIAQSRDNSANSSNAGSAVDIQALSRVPSYDHAMRDKASEDTSPSYE